MKPQSRLAVTLFVAVFSAVALAMTPTPMSWSYPALDGLCLLHESVVIDGGSGAYPIGSTAETKFGKWTCTRVVVSQSPVRTGGVWVQR